MKKITEEQARIIIDMLSTKFDPSMPLLDPEPEIYEEYRNTLQKIVQPTGHYPFQGDTFDLIQIIGDLKTKPIHLDDKQIDMILFEYRVLLLKVEIEFEAWKAADLPDAWLEWLEVHPDGIVLLNVNYNKYVAQE